MVRRGLAVSGTSARRMIDSGAVEVGGIPRPRPATLIDRATPIKLTAAPSRYVGRGGDKLAAALAALKIDVSARRCLDVGAAVGGFTDCLLQHGAASVVAVDVGYGQLAWRLRADDRVQVVERCNFRHVDPRLLGAPFDLVVADVSFISLVTLGRPLAAAGGPDARWLLLVKPQFEVGRSDVGRSGVVTSPALHAGAVAAVASGLQAHDLHAAAVVPSPITGQKGNREFFLLLDRRGPTIGLRTIQEAVSP